MKCFLVVLSLALLTCACDGGASNHFSPTPTYTLSGAVVETTANGIAPVFGAHVQVGSGQATTDDHGFYSIRNLAAGGSVVTATMEGFEVATKPVTIDGNTTLDVELVRKPSFTLSGVVSEMTASGPAPVEGLRLDMFSCEPPSCRHYSEDMAITDRDGFYSLRVQYPGKDNFVWVVSSLYRAEDEPPASLCEGCSRILTITADTQLDIRVVPR